MSRSSSPPTIDNSSIEDVVSLGVERGEPSTWEGTKYNTYANA